jgi:hypothetical protein
MADGSEIAEDPVVQTNTEDMENVVEREGALRNARRIKLGWVTRRMNLIEDLMSDKSNVKKVLVNVNTFGELLIELEAIHGISKYIEGRGSRI